VSREKWKNNERICDRLVTQDCISGRMMEMRVPGKEERPV
jgi:hypothetical protein